MNNTSPGIHLPSPYFSPLLVNALISSSARRCAMSDVAAASAPSTNDRSENPQPSPPPTVPAHQLKPDRLPDSHPSTVTNGLPTDPLLSSQPPTESPDKDDEQLYGTDDHAQPDPDKSHLVTKVKNGDDSDDDPFAGLDDVATMDLYDLGNYTFGKKNEECKSRIMQQLPKGELSAGLEKRYSERGMRRSVGAVILVHSHNFPHILLLQRSDGKGEYALPGGRLRPGESDEEGLQRKLTSKLRPSGSVSGEEEEQQQLDVGDKLCTWHAIDFTRKYYPYVPAHVTKPKEVLNVYAVSLPSKFMFAVPNNLQLVAVPLFELFNNSTTYGDVISAVPALLSRYHVNYC